ncbi:MAG: dienelactone hydrolase family protein [Rhodospirillales bacterium]|nr:dienelactone hydrolase family protein [Rhodospirillales bacterium]
MTTERERPIPLDDARIGDADPRGWHPVTLRFARGELQCRYYPVEHGRKAALWVGGVGGGFDSPAQELYARTAHRLTGMGVASLRLRYRFSTHLGEAVLDTLAGLSFLRSQGIQAAALIGHSLGGAVVIQAAARSALARSVVVLAPQAYGTEAVRDLRLCPIMLIHGLEDAVLPAQCAKIIYNAAPRPKQLHLFERAGHSLDEVADVVDELVEVWITRTLAEAIGEIP